MLSNDNIDKWQQEGTGFWFIYFQNGNCLGGSKIISHGRKHQTLLWLIAVGKNWVFNCWSRKHKHGLHNLQETEAVDLVICHTVSGSLYHNVEDMCLLTWIREIWNWTVSRKKISFFLEHSRTDTSDHHPAHTTQTTRANISYKSRRSWCFAWRLHPCLRNHWSRNSHFSMQNQ